MVVCGGLCAGFRDFLFRGNVIDIAVGIVIGAAFKEVVDGLVADFITPLIGIVGGLPDFSGAAFTVRGSTFRYGDFVNKVLSFIVLAFVIYFSVVIPANHVIAKMKPKSPEVDCPHCMKPKPKAAKICCNCGSEMPEQPKEDENVNVEEKKSLTQSLSRSLSKK